MYLSSIKCLSAFLKIGGICVIHLLINIKLVKLIDFLILNLPGIPKLNLTYSGCIL